MRRLWNDSLKVLNHKYFFPKLYLAVLCVCCYVQSVMIQQVICYTESNNNIWIWECFYWFIQRTGSCESFGPELDYIGRAIRLLLRAVRDDPASDLLHWFRRITFEFENAFNWLIQRTTSHKSLFLKLDYIGRAICLLLHAVISQ